MVKRVYGCIPCGIYCDVCYNCEKDKRHGCDLYPHKVTNFAVKDPVKHRPPHPKMSCPKCGHQMIFKTKFEHRYFKCPKCRYLATAK